MSRSVLFSGTRSGRGLPPLLAGALIGGTIHGSVPVFGLSGDPTAWIDLAIVYTAPGGGDGYYPSVIFDASGFGSGSAGTPDIPVLSLWGIAVLVGLLGGIAVSTLKR